MTPDYDGQLLAILSFDILYVIEMESLKRKCYLNVGKKEASFVYFY